VRSKAVIKLYSHFA